MRVMPSMICLVELEVLYKKSDCFRSGVENSNPQVGEIPVRISS